MRKSKDRFTWKSWLWETVHKAPALKMFGHFNFWQTLRKHVYKFSGSLLHMHTWKFLLNNFLKTLSDTILHFDKICASYCIWSTILCIPREYKNFLFEFNFLVPSNLWTTDCFIVYLFYAVFVFQWLWPVFNYCIKKEVRKEWLN